MNRKGKALSVVLLTLESAAWLAILPLVNAFICMLMAWFMLAAWGTMSIIEGVLLHRRSTEYETPSEPVRLLCTYAPSLLFSGVIYICKLFGGYCLFNFWTTVGISAMGLLISAWNWLNAYLVKRRNG